MGLTSVLAEAIVRLRADGTQLGPDVRRAASSAVDESAAPSGKRFGSEFTKEASGSLAAGAGAIGASGTKAGDQFSDGANEHIKNSSGKFVEGGRGIGKNLGDGMNQGTKPGIDSLASKLFIGLGVAEAVKGIASIGIEYQDSLNTFKAVSGANSAQMQQVGQVAIQLGNDVKLPGVSAAGAAQAMTELAKGGLSVADSMAAAKGTLELARAATVDEGKAAEITANAINAFGIKASRAEFVVDQLAATANASSVEITDVAESMQMAGATFSSFQGPAVGAEKALTELNTAVGLLGNAGVKGSDAGTSLKQMLLQLTSPAHRGTNAMEEVYAAAMGAGGAFNMLDIATQGSLKTQDQWLGELEKGNPWLEKTGSLVYTASGKMRPMREIIDLIAKGTARMTDEQKNATMSVIFGSDAVRAALVLNKAGTKGWDAMTKAVTQHGAAAKVAAAKNAGLGGSIDNMKSQFETLGIQIAGVTQGPLTSMFSQFASGIGFVSANGQAFGNLALVLGAMGGAIATLVAVHKTWNGLMIAGKAAQVVWIALTQGQAAATAVAEAAQVKMNLALLANPIGIVIVAIAGLVAGFILAYKQSTNFRNFVNAALHDVSVAFSWLWDAAKNVFGWLQQHWQLVLAIITGPIGIAALLITKYWTDIVSGAKAAWNAVVGALETAGGAIKNWATELVGGISSAANSAWSALTGFGSTLAGWASTAWSAVAGFFTRLWNAFTALPGQILSSLEAMPGLLGKAFVTAIDAILYAVGYGIGRILRFWIDLPGQLLAGLEALPGLFTSLWQSVFDATQAVLNTAWKWIKNTAISIGKDFIAGIEALPGLVEALWNRLYTGVKTVLTTAWNWIKSTAINLARDFIAGIEALPGMAKAVWDRISSFILTVQNSILNFVKNSAVNIYNFMLDGIENIPSMVKGVWDKVYTWTSSVIGNAVEKAVDLFSSLPGKVGRTLGRLPGQIKDILSDAGEWLYSVGKNVIQGMINGIKDAIGNVVRAASNIAGSLIDGVKRGLGINSPSKVFHAIGLGVTEGMANGIYAGTSDVTDAVDGLGSPGGYDAGSATGGGQQASLDRIAALLERMLAKSGDVRLDGRLVGRVDLAYGRGAI